MCRRTSFSGFMVILNAWPRSHFLLEGTVGVRNKSPQRVVWEFFVLKAIKTLQAHEELVPLP